MEDRSILENEEENEEDQWQEFCSELKDLLIKDGWSETETEGGSIMEKGD